MSRAVRAEQLAQLSKGELIELLLKEGSAKAEGGAAAAADASPPSKKQRRKERVFDMSRHAQRHVALKVAYLGTAYQGFAWQQEAPTATVEGQLLLAATKTCLITDRESCGIVCGGRTDKGVSGLGQVISLRLRSNLRSGEGVLGFVPAPNPIATAATDAAPGSDANARADDAPAAKPELDYVKVLNAVLPEDIRVLAWHPVAPEFSARFSANSRTYKYFFPRGNLDVARMRDAAQRLIGEHDLRNFCKIDPSVANFVRHILSFEVGPACADASDGSLPDSPKSIWAFTIKGTAFLYHQVRCMVAVLFLVGEGKESPEIVTQLLDISRHPRKPNYEMANDAQLLLYEIGYDAIPTWRHGDGGATGADPAALSRALLAVHDLWGEEQRALLLRGAMLQAMRASLPLETAAAAAAAAAAADAAAADAGPGSNGPDLATAAALIATARAGFGPVPPGGGKGSRGGDHKPLMERPTAESVEVRTKGKAK